MRKGMVMVWLALPSVVGGRLTCLSVLHDALCSVWGDERRRVVRVFDKLFGDEMQAGALGSVH